MKRIICNISNTCLKKEVKIETEKYKNPENPIKQIASQFMLRQDQFTLDKTPKIKEIQKCKGKYTLKLTILNPVQNITFIFHNFKILLYNCYNKSHQDIINQFNKQKIYFSPNYLSNLRFKLWDIKIPPEDFKFNCIPSETFIHVEPLNTVILNYNGFTFICSEDDTVSEIKRFILSQFNFSNEVFIKILPNNVDVPENVKLCGRNRYKIELYCLFNFYRSNKHNCMYMKRLDYFTTVFQFKNYYNQIFNEREQIRPENIIIHHPTQGGYEIDRCYLIDLLSYNQLMKKYMIYYHIIEQSKNQGNEMDNHPEQLENNQEMKNQNKNEENRSHQKTNSIKQDQIDHENQLSSITSSETKQTKYEDQTHSQPSQQVHELCNGEESSQNLKHDENPHKISKRVSKSRFKPKIIRKEEDDNNDEPQQNPKPKLKPKPNQEKKKESEESTKYSFKFKNTIKFIKLKNDSILIENEPIIKELFQIESNESLHYSIVNDDDGNDDEQSESIDASECILKSLKNKLIEISIENKIESQNGQTKIMKKYLYQTNDDKDIHEIELDSQAKIIDMKESIAKLNNVSNVSNIKILFAGKDLLNDIVLDSLEVESSVLFVYIRSQEDILLMTAKALRFNDPNLSDESGYSDE